MLTGAVAAPAAPAVGYGAAALFTLLAFLVCAGLNHAWGATLGWGFKWLADQFDALSFHVKFIGRVRPLGPIAASFRWVDRKVSHLLGVAALNTEHAFVYCVHGFAHTIEYMAAEIARLSATVYHAALRFDRVILPRWLRHAYRFSLHAAHVVERRVMGEVGRVWRDVHAVEHAFGRAVRRARAEEKRLTRLSRLLAGAAFAAAVATALRRLGLKWLRCSNAKKTAKSLCGMDVNLLESLLLDATAIVGTISVVAMAEELQAIEGEAVKLMRGFVRELP